MRYIKVMSLACIIAVLAPMAAHAAETVIADRSQGTAFSISPCPADGESERKCVALVAGSRVLDTYSGAIEWTSTLTIRPGKSALLVHWSGGHDLIHEYAGVLVTTSENKIKLIEVAWGPRAYVSFVVVPGDRDRNGSDELLIETVTHQERAITDWSIALWRITDTAVEQIPADAYERYGTKTYALIFETLPASANDSNARLEAFFGRCTDTTVRAGLIQTDDYRFLKPGLEVIGQLSTRKPDLEADLRRAKKCGVTHAYIKRAR